MKGVEFLNKSSKYNRRTPLSQTHEDKRKVWTEDNLKTDFSKAAVFTKNSKVMRQMDLMVGRKVGVLQDRSSEAPVIKRPQR